ncbi:hypothetical protein [Blattabacterium cuenoti]|uniref:hypothetical protein n=1 Tax=Blattabacterium cuenoti TaxID=1653831 RepID=UPI00163D03AF|nr:hypothetical protein [Blattabacterium cuenoti]
MNFKEIKSPINTETIDCLKLEKKSGKNIYETISILEKVANKMNFFLKKNLDKKLEDFNFMNKNNLEEIIENQEQINLSKSYEKLPKTTSMAIQYLLKNKLKIN